MPSPQPRFINVAGIARRCYVSATAVWHWIDRYPPGHPTQPTPTPAGWEETTRGDKPLWNIEQLPEWESWRARQLSRNGSGS